jgi:hypothetical protein
MEVGALIEVCTLPERDAIGKAQADIIFDGGGAFHPEDDPVCDAPDRNSHNRGNPSKQPNDRLFKKVTTDGGSLTAEIQANGCEHGLTNGKQACSATPT